MSDNPYKSPEPDVETNRKSSHPQLLQAVVQGVVASIVVSAVLFPLINLVYGLEGRPDSLVKAVAISIWTIANAAGFLWAKYVAWPQR